jgi:hypothetical protein
MAELQSDASTFEKIAQTPLNSPGAPVGGSGTNLITEVPIRDTEMVVEALSEALPVHDIVFGGAVLVLVIMFHAFWIRIITNSFLERTHPDRAPTRLWEVDLMFALMVLALLSLHLSEVVLWSVALVMRGIVNKWSVAALFAANCYTALGQPFALPLLWRMVAPIIAMSGIFTFAWTASVLVNFVARYNALRAELKGLAPKGTGPGR